MKLTKINLKEREELEPMIINDPRIIEEGLKIITHQLKTDSGPLDILAVDSDNCLVIIELKIEAVDNHIDQSLRYYDWCTQNISWIAQTYKSFNINPETQPRLILISPSYTETVKRIAKYINAELQLYEYVALENEKSEKTIVCTPIDFGQKFEPTIIQTEEKKLEYFRDKKIRELFERALEELKSKKVEVRPISGLWFSFYYKNKRFMYMSPKKNFFVAQILTPEDNWTQRLRINNENDWENIFHDHIMKYLKHLDSK